VIRSVPLLGEGTVYNTLLIFVHLSSPHYLKSFWRPEVSAHQWMANIRWVGLYGSTSRFQIFPVILTKKKKKVNNIHRQQHLTGHTSITIVNNIHRLKCLISWLNLIMLHSQYANSCVSLSSLCPYSIYTYI